MKDNRGAEGFPKRARRVSEGEGDLTLPPSSIALERRRQPSPS